MSLSLAEKYSEEIREGGEATREHVCDVSWQLRQMEERSVIGRPFTAAQ